MAIYIYGLFCPAAQQIRYIGKTADLRTRLIGHLYCAGKPRTHRDRWLAKLKRAGLRPELRILRELSDDADWVNAEREEIAKGFAAGWPLTNLTRGGEGAVDNEEGRKRRKARMSRPETRAKMSAAAKARWADPTKGAKGRAENGSPERRAKVAEGARRRATEEYRAAQRERSLAAWSDPEKRSRIVGGITADTRGRVSEASRNAWRTSPNMARCLKNLKRREAKT